MSITKSNTNFLNHVGTSVYAYSRGKVDMHYVSTLSEGMNQNSKGADLYFIANPSTGMKESSVKELSCNFIDLDAGRPDETSYHSTTVVNAFKRRIMTAIASDEFNGLKPSYIVETRNGYHLYWVYETRQSATATTLHEWKFIEKFLITKFAHLGADPHVNKPNQLLRVPGTYWHKKWNGNKKFPSFLTTILPTKKKRTMYRFGDLLRMARQEINAISTPVSTNIISVATARSSYQPHQDVNSNTNFDRLFASGKSNSPSSDDVSVLFDIVAYLRSQNMNFLATKLENHLNSSD